MNNKKPKAKKSAGKTIGEFIKDNVYFSAEIGKVCLQLERDISNKWLVKIGVNGWDDLNKFLAVAWYKSGMDFDWQRLEDECGCAEWYVDHKTFKKVLKCAEDIFHR